jgi:hypothetical protein
MSQYDRNNNQLLKELSLQYLGGKKCCNCGVDYLPICCYDFHHNKATKEENISQMIKGKTKLDAELKNELDKCVVLCANCHRQVTSRIIRL